MANIIHSFLYSSFFLMIRNNYDTFHRLKNLLKSSHNTSVLHLYS